MRWAEAIVSVVILHLLKYNQLTIRKSVPLLNVNIFEYIAVVSL